MNTTTEGNYWSDYIGTPTYAIDEINKDYFLLLNPRNPPVGVTPPITTEGYDGFWHTANFTINLHAVDDLSGVEETFFKIDGGSISNVSEATLVVSVILVIVGFVYYLRARRKRRS